MKTFTLFLFLGLLCWQTGCGKSQEAEDHGHDHGEHAGHDHGDDAGHDHAPGLLEIGDHVGHIQFEHDHEAGSVTLTFTAPDAKTPLLLTVAPKLNLTGDSPVQLQTVAVASDAGGTAVFSVTDEALKAEPEGRIAVTIGEQAYQVAIAHSH
ncbi:MAG: hypothetical protein ACI8W8_004846 [Rhodothermales bacterium]|jgi:hypothetical protein